MLVDKDAGPTAHDVVDALRRSLGIRRIGHTGTLDPFATGLLIMLVGRATRLARFVADLPKVYSGTIRLGQTTDTDDSTGRVLSDVECGAVQVGSRIEEAMSQLTGRMQQRPPAFSAKKVAGERAYRRARKGEEFELQAKEVEVYSFRPTGAEGSEVRFICEVSGGTYVRALARDLGTKLGCGAHLQVLRRESIGPFHVSDASPVSVVRPDTQLNNPADLVAHLESLQLDSETRSKVVHGQPIPAGEVGPGPVSLIADGELVAVAARDGDLLKPKVVLEG